MYTIKRIIAMPYARLSKHGYSQEVRLPKDFRMAGTRVKISKHGEGSILLEPVEDDFSDLLEALDMFSSDFMQDGRGQLPYDNREIIFE